ncbi:PAS domain-containing protein [bacterium]|nr:PAS domain-containing protein [bacterium]
MISPRFRWSCSSEAGGSAAESVPPEQGVGPELLAILLREVDLPLLCLGHDLRVLAFNKAYLQLCGLRSHDWLGRHLLEMNPELQGSNLLQAIDNCLEDSKQVTLEPTISSRYMSSRIIPASFGVVVIFEDSEARRGMELLRWELLDGVAHAFQTPLTSIFMFTDNLLAGGVDPSTQRDFLERIRSQAGVLSDGVGDLLRLSRIDSSASHEELDLRRCAAECVDRYFDMAENRGLSIDPSGLGDRGLLVRGSDSDLQLAISNLLDNAIKYSNFGGVIGISLERLGDEAALSISDQGIGIESDALTRIFERFYRADTVRRGDFRGNGLGLALVDKIIKLHDGRVEVTSIPGHGSTFTIILPLA